VTGIIPSFHLAGNRTLVGAGVDEQLKRRLVGAVVLVSLAVIFIPMLLDPGEPTHIRITETNVPPPPVREDAFRSAVQPMLDDEPLIPPQPVPPAPAPDASGALPDPQTGGEVAAIEPPSPRVGISAWVVQVASLSNRSNADGLVADLKDKGFSAFLEQVYVNGRDLFRVRVGPEIDKARAERLANEIHEALRLQGQVVRYP
jgi:DedD protein